jgi:hypothetical protein
MACWVMELSPAGMASYAADADMMSPKVERVYRRLMFYCRRFGSAPDELRSLAEILGVTARYLRDRAWPILQDLFEARDGRLFHPEVERATGRAARAVLAEKSATYSANARKRWDRQQTEMLMPIGQGADATGMQNGMQTDAKNPAISMPVASGFAEVASPSDARALSLSPSSLSSTSLDSGDSESEERKEEGARVAREADANSMQSDANLHAAAPAKPPPLAPLPADWQPSPAVAEQARTLGLDPVAVAVRFCAHYTARGTKMADWDAQFVSWCHREPAFQQGGTAQTGGAPASNKPGSAADYFKRSLEQLSRRQA